MTFNDVRRLVDSYGADSRERDWKASALSTLFKLTTGPIGRIMNSTSGSSLQAILDSPVVLELSGLGSETDRRLFSQTFLLWLYYYRLAEGKSASLKHALIIEEAHNLFLKRGGEAQSIHDFIMRQMRDLGEALILLDQNPSLLTTPSLGNTGVTICLNLKHADDVAAAAKALTLPRENWDCIGRLPVGQAIVKLQDRWVKPFLVYFPQFAVPNRFQTSQAKRADSRSDSIRRSIEEFRQTISEAIRAIPETARREKEQHEMSMQERNLLVDIVNNPLSVVTERYKRLGWNAYAGTKVKQQLLEKGLVQQENVSVPSGCVTLLKLTPQGRELLESSGITAKALPKNASLEHEYWKRLVAQEYRRKGYEVEEEVPIGGGKAVDLVATKDGKRIALEIETGKSDPLHNITKCCTAGFDEVVTIGTGGQVLKTISKNETEP
jgi:DNA-binding MarR family transcriptional regulator